jgi:hypothetical protein
MRRVAAFDWSLQYDVFRGHDVEKIEKKTRSAVTGPHNENFHLQMYSTVIQNRPNWKALEFPASWMK